MTDDRGRRTITTELVTDMLDGYVMAVAATARMTVAAWSLPFAVVGRPSPWSTLLNGNLAEPVTAARKPA